MRTRPNKSPETKLPRLAGDESVELWPLDEVHFQQYGSRCRMWVPPENRVPVPLHYPTRRSVGYFGAVRLRDGRFVCRREIPDKASYHHARLHKPWREAHAERIALEFLPAYSPELNPIERVWKFTCRRCLHNRYFPQLARVIETVESEFAAWAHHSESWRRLCAIL